MFQFIYKKGDIKLTTHYIKLKKQFCDAVYFGDKPFEIRKNDRCYQKGDHIKFLPVNETGDLLIIDGKKIPSVDHPIEDKEYEITYVLSGWGLERDYVVFGIKEVKE